MTKPKKPRPKWQSDRGLSQPLKPFEGDCSFAVYRRVIAKQREAKLLHALDCYGISRDDPDSGWKLAAHLALEHITGFQIAEASGRQAEDRDTIDDAVILTMVAVAKQKDPAAQERKIIRGWAKTNNRSTNREFLETKRRRLQDAKKPGSQRRKRIAKLLAGMLPDLEARAKELEIAQKRKKGVVRK